ASRSLSLIGTTSATGSVQQVGLVAEDLVVQRLEAEPTREAGPDLAVGLLGALLVDEDRRAGRLGHELDLAAALHADVPPGGLVHGAADGEQPVVPQDGRLVVAERVGDALA